MNLLTVISTAARGWTGRQRVTPETHRGELRPMLKIIRHMSHQVPVPSVGGPVQSALAVNIVSAIPFDPASRFKFNGGPRIIRRFLPAEAIATIGNTDKQSVLAYEYHLESAVHIRGVRFKKNNAG